MNYEKLKQIKKLIDEILETQPTPVNEIVGDYLTTEFLEENVKLKERKDSDCWIWTGVPEEISRIRLAIHKQTTKNSITDDQAMSMICNNIKCVKPSHINKTETLSYSHSSPKP